MLSSVLKMNSAIKKLQYLVMIMHVLNKLCTFSRKLFGNLRASRRVLNHTLEIRDLDNSYCMDFGVIVEHCRFVIPMSIQSLRSVVG